MLLFVAYLLVLFFYWRTRRMRKNNSCGFFKMFSWIELSCCCFGPQYQGIIISHSHLTSPEVGKEEDEEQIYRLVQRDEWWRKQVSFPVPTLYHQYIIIWWEVEEESGKKNGLKTYPSSSSSTSYHLTPSVAILFSQLPLNWWSYHRIVY